MNGTQRPWEQNLRPRRRERTKTSGAQSTSPVRRVAVSRAQHTPHTQPSRLRATRTVRGRSELRSPQLHRRLLNKQSHPLCPQAPWKRRLCVSPSFCADAD